MNNEPVAWTTNELDTTNWGDTDWQITVTKERWSDKQIPLYTHPAKTLTDEEIEQVRVAIMGAAYWCADENMQEAYNAVKVCCSEVLAILRKAQEK